MVTICAVFARCIVSFALYLPLLLEPVGDVQNFTQTFLKIFEKYLLNDHRLYKLVNLFPLL